MFRLNRKYRYSRVENTVEEQRKTDAIIVAFYAIFNLAFIIIAVVLYISESLWYLVPLFVGIALAVIIGIIVYRFLVKFKPWSKFTFPLISALILLGSVSIIYLMNTKSEVLYWIFVVIVILNIGFILRLVLDFSPQMNR